MSCFAVAQTVSIGELDKSFGLSFGIKVFEFCFLYRHIVGRGYVADQTQKIFFVGEHEFGLCFFVVGALREKYTFHLEWG